MSFFRQIFAEAAAPLLAETLGEGAALTISGPGLPEDVTIPAAIVDKLRTIRIDQGQSIVSRETTTVRFSASLLPAEKLPFGPETTVSVPHYPGAAFNVDADVCEFGGPMIKLGLIRVPVVRLGPMQSQGGN